MISENLRNLQRHLARHQDDGVELTASEVVAICSILERAVDDAREIEARTVPPVDRLAELPGNVVRLAAKLHARGVRLGAEATSRDPGGAA